MSNNIFHTDDFLSYDFEKIVRHKNHCDYIREIAILVINRKFNQKNIKSVLSKYRIKSVNDIKTEILEMLIDYAIIVLADNKITEKEKENFNFLKDNLGIQEGDFYRYTPVYVSIIIKTLIEKICWITNLQDKLEKKFDADMREFFSLNDEQLNQLKNYNIREFLERLNNKKHKVMPFLSISDGIGLVNLVSELLPTDSNRLKRIADSLMNDTLCSDTDVKEFIIRSKIQEVFGYDNKKIQERDIYKRVIITIYNRYKEKPPKLMPTTTVSKIIQKLEELFEGTDNKEETPPKSVIGNIEPKIKSEEQPAKQPANTTKPKITNYDCLLQVYSQLEFDKSYTLEEIKKGFETILTKNGISSTNSSIDTYIRTSIVNYTSRHHYNVKSPNDKGLFYYTNESTRDYLQKFSFDIKDNPTIYWTGENKERKEIKLSEIVLRNKSNNKPDTGKIETDTKKNNQQAKKNFNCEGFDVVGFASASIGNKKYLIKRFTNNMIRLFDETENPLNMDVRPVLLKINDKYKLGIELSHSTGREKNTQILGKEIINELNKNKLET